MMKRLVAGLIVALWTNAAAADTLKDGYFFCVVKSSYNLLMDDIAKGDERGIRHSLWDGCMITWSLYTIEIVNISKSGAAKVRVFFYPDDKKPTLMWVHKDAIERTANTGSGTLMAIKRVISDLIGSLWTGSGTGTDDTLKDDYWICVEKRFYDQLLLDKTKYVGGCYATNGGFNIQVLGYTKDDAAKLRVHYPQATVTMWTDKDAIKRGK